MAALLMFTTVGGVGSQSAPVRHQHQERTCVSSCLSGACWLNGLYLLNVCSRNRVTLLASMKLLPAVGLVACWTRTSSSLPHASGSPTGFKHSRTH